MIISPANSTTKTPIYYETDVFVLEKWNHPIVAYSVYVGRACGPTALLQAMKGFFSAYGYQRFGVQNYSEMYDRCWSYWDINKTTATTYSGLKKGLEKITENKLTLTYGWYCFWYGINFEHIKNEWRILKSSATM